MKLGIFKDIEGALNSSHHVSVLLKGPLEVREQLKVFCIHAHDLHKDSRPDVVKRICQGYGAIVTQLQWIALLVEQQYMALFPVVWVVWGVTCHPHQDEHLVYGLLHMQQAIHKITSTFAA